MADPSLFGEPEPAEWQRLLVHGDPWPQPRPRHSIRGKGSQQFVHVYLPTAARKRMQAVGQGWLDAGLDSIPSGTPVEVDLLFVFDRPAGHLGAQGNVRPAHARQRPAGAASGAKGRRYGGDLDNLAKHVLDALSGFAYDDDGQVAECRERKLYVDQVQGFARAGTLIAVRPLAG